MFSIVGAFLYIASGSCAIDYNTSLTLAKESRDSGLALGSFCIITGNFGMAGKWEYESFLSGIVLLMDAAFLVTKYARRLK